MAVYLDPNMVPASMRGGYQGKKFQAEVCETVTIPRHAGLWDGGSRSTWTAIDTAWGHEVAVSDNMSAPTDARQDRHITLSPQFCVVKHSIFRGKDMGLTFYVHPETAAKLLPAPSAELSVYEKLVLCATNGLKSSYGGKDRYQMAESYYGDVLKGAAYPTREQWDAAKADLIGKGMLNRAGAITPSGRNAAK